MSPGRLSRATLSTSFFLEPKYHTISDFATPAFLATRQSVAAAISVMALGPNSALAPSLIPAIQSIVAITYLRVLPSLNKWFTKRTSETAKTKK